MIAPLQRNNVPAISIPTEFLRHKVRAPNDDTYTLVFTLPGPEMRMMPNWKEFLKLAPVATVDVKEWNI